MLRRTPFAIGEWYHCYSRGVDKRNTFLSQQDYERFIEYLFLANSTKAIHRSNRVLPHKDIFLLERGEQYVEIAAYCLMPNHFHILIREVREGGITAFMRSLGTAYAMYFNKKQSRIGNIFVKPFRSKHVAHDNYLLKVVQYIHLNPMELFEPHWKKGRVRSLTNAIENVTQYSYSSIVDYIDPTARPETHIINPDTLVFFSEQLPTLKESAKDARDYYESLEL